MTDTIPGPGIRFKLDEGTYSKTADTIGIMPATDPVSNPEWDYFQGLVNIARRSAAKARVKFPQPNYVTLKIAEEAGEVVRGAVHYAEGRMEWDEVQGEIVQLLAMLIRFVTEGDEVNGIKPPDLVMRVPPAAALARAAEPAVTIRPGYTDDPEIKLLEGPINIGDQFIWEPTKPNAYKHIIVTRITHPEGDERRIWAQELGQDKDYWNDESRFREACERVTTADTVATSPAADPVSKPDPLGAEWLRERCILIAYAYADTPGVRLSEILRALPGATDAELDRAALARPKVRALVAAANAVIHQDALPEYSGRYHAVRLFIGKMSDALTALEAGE
jgi:hypothetical protein